MKTLAQDLLSFLRTNQPTMVAQLHHFCEINSGSDNGPGLSTMHRTLSAAFAPLADEITTLSLPPMSTMNMAGESCMEAVGDVLYLRIRPELPHRVLLSGHMDTVYGASHPFQTLTYLNDNHLVGPGVADMKGGLIVMLHALMAFEETPYRTALGFDVIINADEEIGSPGSSTLFAGLVKNHRAALLYEPAVGRNGSFAKNRKGSGKLTLVATGKAAHAGRSFDQGRNAICFLAEAITAIHALNGTRAGVTINVGKIAGGDALNVVPDKAVAKLDIRISAPEDEPWVRDQLTRIIARMSKEGYSLTIHGEFSRPVKRVDKATQDLFFRLQRLGEELGLSLDWEDSGGCCDGNNFSALGLPVIDTLGVRGGDIHSSNEFVLLDSLVERATLSALLLIELARERIEESTL